MKLLINFVTNLKTKEVVDKVKGAGKKALLVTATAIANDAIQLSPVNTGNNRRSIKYEVGPGEVAKSENEAAIYSTSGYGGYLETGTVKMAAKPYFKPALDKNKDKLAEGIKAELK